MKLRHLHTLALASCLVLAACGGGRTGTGGQANVDGQVSTAPASSATYYQAARLLDQASWGPSPDAIAEVQASGVEAWIDRQLALPPTTFNAPRFVIDHDNNNRAQRDQANGWVASRFYDGALGGNDQLRQRVSWALFNFVPIGNVQPYAQIEYYNMFQRQSLGNFKDFLREVTLHSAMGFFLNNDQNEANRPNENYARELMQLFTVGLVLLNPDGTTQRDARGAPIETYSQQDVKEATRALTGWRPVWEENLPRTNFANFGKRMQPANWSNAHDFGAKRVLGKDIPAGQNAERDLESLLDVLLNHPNTAPFVSRRLIQSLVSSDPSPAYMARVSAVFTQTKGDLKAVVRAILLDPEARAGDNPSKAVPRVGKIKEPILSHTMALRAMGCRSAIADRNDPSRPLWGGQEPYAAPSVFGYFAPNHKTPESLKPAPEEKLLNGNEFNNRAGNISWQLEGNVNGFRSAGCQLDPIEAAARQSDEALITLISQRYFRGAMPQPLRLTMQTLLRDRLGSEEPLRKFGDLVGLALVSPYFGAVK